MSFEFRPAKRENVPLLIGLAGGTGSGKTYSAMMLAKGMAGKKRFAVIDTEAGRAQHYAEEFPFDHADLKPPFRPSAYAEAITAADKAGYPVVVVDSASHEHAGEGGLLDWHEEELDRMAGDDWKKRDAVKFAAWIKPKQAHKAFVNQLLQLRCHLILCFRAEEKIEIAKENGKTVVRPKKTLTGLDGWIPVSEKNLPYELTLSFLLTAAEPGLPRPIKLQAQHRAFFADGQLVSEQMGKQLAEWAGGATLSESEPQAGMTPPSAPSEGEPVSTPVREEPSGSESAVDKLTIELIETAKGRGNSATVVQAIRKNRAAHADDLGKHEAWLVKQLANLQTELPV